LRTQRLVSSGGVIFRQSDGQYEVALIYTGRNWGLPKGLIEKAETAEETALREVREETGLEGEMVKKIGKISYSFTRRKRYSKTVHFYLLKYVGGSLQDHDYEVAKVKWFPISKAIQTVTYTSEREILKKARNILGGETNSRKPPVGNAPAHSN